MGLSARRECYLPSYTYDDYFQWEGQWELICGIAYAMTPAPLILHQAVSHRIDVQLGNMLQVCDKCQALLPVDWKIADDTVVQPDNLVICYEPEGAYLVKAPSLIFEIVSKSSRVRDTEVKFELYEQEGVDYYCLVFPDDKIAKVYELLHGRYVKVGDFSDEVVEFDLGDACHFSFRFAEIWGGIL